MPVDPSVFNNQKTYQDYKNQQDALDLQRVQLGAQLQSANIDTLTKKNVLKGQYLSAAAGTGDQGIWDATRQKLGNIGIDVSDAPVDVASGTKYADALKLAQSPYGALINGGSKIAELTGVIPPALTNLIAPKVIPPSDQNPVPQGTSALPSPTLPNLGTQPSIIPVQIGDALPPVGGTPDPQTAAALAAYRQQNGMATPPIDNERLTNNLPVGVGSNLPNGASMTTGINQPASPRTIPAPQTSIVVPPKLPNETLDAYKLRISNDPNVIAQQEKAKAIGKTAADAQKGAIESGEGFNLVNQNLNSIEALAPKLPQQSWMIGSQTKADFNQNFGGDDKSIANNFNTFKTINEAQTINAIKNLANTGQIRMSRTLENIINRGYLVDQNASPEGKIAQVNVIRAEMKNSAVNAQNVNAQMNGGDTQAYTNPISTINATPQIDPRSKEGLQSLSNARSWIAKNPSDIDAVNAKLKASGLPMVGQ